MYVMNIYMKLILKNVILLVFMGCDYYNRDALQQKVPYVGLAYFEILAKID